MNQSSKLVVLNAAGSLMIFSQGSSPKMYRKITDQVTLSAIKATEKWGKEVLHNAKEYVEEITL